jgi:recombination protein RecA
VEFDIMYGHGISQEGGLLDLGVEMGLVDKRGSYYSFAETQMGQGRENVKDFLKDNPGLALTLENEIRQAAGLPPRAAPEEVTVTEPAD